MSTHETSSASQSSVGSDPLVYEPGDSVEQIVADWLERPALRRMVEEFGGTWPSGDLVHRLTALLEFSVVWDRRQGASRLQIQESVDDSSLARDVLASAGELGLLSQPPLQRNRYDWALVLGGLATGCLSRVEAVSDVLTAGTAVGGIALLGSFRQLQDPEIAALADESFVATSEITALQMASDRWLGTSSWDEQVTGDVTTDPRHASLHATATASSGLVVHAFASASSAPEERAANTADTYHTAVAELAMQPAARILLVTSRIYRYQWLDAIRVLGLPENLSIEVYGTESGPSSRRDFGPSWYLQEMRSMIRSSLALLT